MNDTVCAVVLTYNRKELLDKCLEALINQDYKLNSIVVVDNCSDDGTNQVIDKYINYVVWKRLDKNYGASYGFNIAIKEGYNQESDFVWIMDDDTIPDHDALLRLVEKSDALNDPKLGFICSNVLWKDGTPCKMNIPRTDEGKWNFFINKGVIVVESCSFVSVMIPRRVIKIVGLPISQFYIWSTDLEYTSRITKYYGYNGYLVTDSSVLHAMQSNRQADIIIENGSRIERFKYNYRNQMFMAKKESKIKAIKYYLYGLRTIGMIMKRGKPYRIKKIKALLWGINSGIFFNPSIEAIEEIRHEI